MKSARRERSTSEASKVVFNPPSKPVPLKVTDKLFSINLPGIATKLSQFPNPPPIAAPKEAIGIPHTNQESIVELLSGIDPNLVSRKRSNKKDPEGERKYDVRDLRTIAAKFGITSSKKKKPELSAVVSKKLNQFHAPVNEGTEN